MRLLGGYDNVWLSHADRGAHRDPTTSAAAGRAPTAGSATRSSSTAFMAGLWWDRDGRVDLELFRDLTRAERADLDAEVARTEAFLAAAHPGWTCWLGSAG